MIEDYLEHYGIKGQKWGSKKSIVKYNPRNSIQRKAVPYIPTSNRPSTVMYRPKTQKPNIVTYSPSKRALASASNKPVNPTAKVQYPNLFNKNGKGG